MTQLVLGQVLNGAIIGAMYGIIALGITLTRVELDQVYRRVIARCDERKTFGDADLTAVINEVRLQPTR